jgi:hypothetical protein
MRSSTTSLRRSSRLRVPEAGAAGRSPAVAARPPPGAPWEGDAPPSPPAALREADATAWLLRVIVGFAGVALALDELLGAGPSALHAALPAGALAGLAALELVAGAAVLVAASRAGIHTVAVVFAALSVALLAAGSALALQTAFVAGCAIVLGLLDRLLRRSRGRGR